MQENFRLDAKDFAILRELDINFRQPFSKIAKKVNLSKNSVALRFEKLKSYMLHNTTGINNELVGYTMAKVYYTFDFYNEHLEKEIIKELKKYKNIIWAARFYGIYDLFICLLVNNIEDLLLAVNKFNERFSRKINQKEMQITFKQFYFRHNYVHQEPIRLIYEVDHIEKKIPFTETEKRIIRIMRHQPRISSVEIAQKTGISTKTVLQKIKNLRKNNVIMGYFMTLDPVKFNYSSFKLLIQVQNLKRSEDLENYLKSIKNIRYFTKMIGLWDYEIDCVYASTTALQQQIENLKQKFPHALKKISILNFGKRILTNTEHFLA